MTVQLAKKLSTSFLILHNIRSTYNVGSIFRTAEAAGVSKIYLTGYTPLPVDRFGRKRKDIAKVALGAEEMVPFEHIMSPSVLIKRLKKEGVMVICVEQAPQAVDYRKLSFTYPAAYLFGNEVSGISKKLRGHCDIISHIPLYGAKESLNVSVAVGVVLFGTLKV